jgi:AbrB family looped-hinge helix DNA binding protein
MAIATLTSKGQTTVPRDIRERLGLEPGDQLHFTLLPNGTVVMRAKKRSLAALAGSLHAPRRRPVSAAHMTEVVARAAADRARAPRRRRTRAKQR